MMKIVMLLVSTIFIIAAKRFDRSVNQKLYDEIDQARSSEYSSAFAMNNNNSEEGSSGGSSSIASDAQTSYSRPSFYTSNQSYSNEWGEGESVSHRWVGTAESGHSEITNINGEQFAFYAPENVEIMGEDGDFQISYAWSPDGGNTQYEVCLFNDGAGGVYKRTADDWGGNWIYETHVPESSYDDLPDEVKGYLIRK